MVEDAVPRAAALGARPGSGVQRMGREQVRILAVDDDPQALRYLHETLTRAGYAAMVTGDPGEALSFMEANAPHLALLDLYDAGTDGIELMKDIRSVANIPVILLSAYDQEEVVVRAFDTGADDYVVKPFSPCASGRLWGRVSRRSPTSWRPGGRLPRATAWASRGVRST